MIIDLIAKNEVAEYVKENPEAGTYLSMWLKEMKYMNRMHLLDAKSAHGTAMGQSQLGASKYTIKYIVNIGHKTAVILFFGTREEEIAFHQKEVEKYMAENPGKKLITKTFSVTVKSPPPVRSAVSPKVSAPIGDNEELAFPDYVDNNLTHQTKEGYENNLARAIDIFKSPPGTDGYLELETLLPLIKNYESQHIMLPQFNMLEALKLRMNDFKLTPKDLIYNIGTEEDVVLFLTGKKIPAKKVLKKVYNMLGLRIPADRKDFVMD